MISMIGMISTASPRAMQYSSRSMGVKSKALANAGISITAVVRIRDAIIAANRNLLWVFKVNREPLRLLIFKEWKISTMESVKNAIVVPSALSTNSQTPLST